MDCQDYRNDVIRTAFDPEPIASGLEPAINAHREQCADCRRWTDEQLKLDRCITDWVQQIPAVDLTQSVVATYLREETIRGTSDSKEQKFAARKLAISRRGLAALVATIAATLVFAVSQTSFELRQVFDHSQVVTQDHSESDPVTSIVSSVRNVVDNVASTPATAVAKLPQTSLIPDLQVGTLQYTREETSTIPAPRWANVREDLQPLETEVRQAFSFIWSALPEEEI